MDWRGGQDEIHGDVMFTLPARATLLRQADDLLRRHQRDGVALGYAADTEWRASLCGFVITAMMVVRQDVNGRVMRMRSHSSSRRARGGTVAKIASVSKRVSCSTPSPALRASASARGREFAR